MVQNISNKGLFGPTVWLFSSCLRSDEYLGRIFCLFSRSESNWAVYIWYRIGERRCMDYLGSHHLIFGVSSPGVRDCSFLPRGCEQLAVHNGFLVSEKAYLVSPFWLFSSYLGSDEHIERNSFSFADLSTCSTFDIKWWRWVFLAFTTETSASHPGPCLCTGFFLLLSRISERPPCPHSIPYIKEESWPEYSNFPSFFSRLASVAYEHSYMKL